MRGLVAVALLLAGSAAVAGQRPLIDRYGTGGTLHSPDGRWAITAPPAPPKDKDDDYSPAPAFLRGPGVRRHLLDYDRLLDAHWAQDGRHVLLSLIDLDGEYLDVRTLGPRETGRPGRINTSVLRQMARVRPLLHQADVQHLAFGRIAHADCILVEQDGTPRGRRTGSFVNRRAAFRLDLDGGRAIPIRSCPGARLS